MKKILFLSIALCSGILLTSCEERLNIEQKATSSTDNFYKTDNDAISAVTAMYAQYEYQLGSAHDTYIWNPLIMGLNYSSDDVFAAGGDITDHIDFRVMNEFRYDTKSLPVKFLYTKSYAAIYSANLVINYFKDADTPTKKRCVAEARVMRAWAHMLLALTYYQPPLVDHLLVSGEKPTNVESQKFLLDWCTTECEEAMNDLNDRKSSGDKEGAYYATKGFAQFVAGKSAVFAGDWQRAYKNLKPLVESTNYALVSGDRFRDLFHVEGDGSEEKIFEFNYGGNSNITDFSMTERGRWMVANVLNWRGDDLGGKPLITASGGWGGGAINDQFAIKMYKNDGDGPRRKATFLTPDEFLYDTKLCGWPSDKKADGTEMTLEEKKADPKRGIINANGTFSRGIYMEVKMMMHPNDAYMAIGDNCNNTNMCIARLAEAYLLYAEACLNTNNITEGKKYLNMIQRRAEAPETELTLQTLQDEKQYELWFEGCRFHDIVRWGIAKQCYDKVLDNIPYCYDDYFIEGTPYYKKEHHLRAVTKHPLSQAGVPHEFIQGKHEYFPIPADILELNDQMKQVRGWATGN